METTAKLKNTKSSTINKSKKYEKVMWTTRERKNSIFNYSQSYPQYPQVLKVDKYDKKELNRYT